MSNNIVELKNIIKLGVFLLMKKFVGHYLVVIRSFQEQLLLNCLIVFYKEFLGFFMDAGYQSGALMNHAADDILIC